MTNIPDWIMAICAILSFIVSIVSIAMANGASNKVKTLTTQVGTLTAELNKISSSMKDSEIKQVNKGGSGNRFAGGNYNG